MVIHLAVYHLPVTELGPSHFPLQALDIGLPKDPDLKLQIAIAITELMTGYNNAICT